jgi:hypothetical protein
MNGNLFHVFPSVPVGKQVQRTFSMLESLTISRSIDDCI